MDEEFIWPEGKRPDVVHDKFDFDLPVVDLSPLAKLAKLQEEFLEFEKQGQSVRSGFRAEMQACEAAIGEVQTAMREAFQEYGFFQIINHGLPIQLVEQLSECFRQIFNLPLEEKMKANEGTGKGGYTHLKRVTGFTKNLAAHVWNEGFNIDLPVENHPGRLEELTENIWPTGAESTAETKRQNLLFRSTVDEYGKKCSNLVYQLLNLLASSLGLPEGSVESLVGPLDKEVPGRIRANYYPVCPQPELTWGLPGHADPGVITLLHQDVVGGLQIRFSDGTWHGVRPNPEALVVNAGDFLQAWTNKRLVSAEHRAVTNAKYPRLSIVYFAFFSFRDKNAIVSTRPELVDAEHPLLYKPFTQEQYFRALATHGLSKDRGALLEQEFAVEPRA